MGRFRGRFQRGGDAIRPFPPPLFPPLRPLSGAGGLRPGREKGGAGGGGFGAPAGGWAVLPFLPLECGFPQAGGAFFVPVANFGGGGGDSQLQLQKWTKVDKVDQSGQIPKNKVDKSYSRIM